MNVEDMDRDALLEEVSRLQRKIDGLKEASRKLEHQLQTRDTEIIKVKRELQSRIAEAICRENDLRRNQDRFRTLVANIPGAVYRCANDAFWTMEFMSGQVEEISGYPSTDFIGNAVRSYKSIVHPEDVIKVINAVTDGINAQTPYMVDYRIKHRDGSVRQVYERGIGVYTDDGTLLWLDGVIFDQHHIPSHRDDSLPEW